MHPLISTSPPFPHGTWGATTLSAAQTFAATPTPSASGSDNRTLRSALRGALLHESNAYHLGYGLGSAMNRWRDAEFARGQAEAEAGEDDDQDELDVYPGASSWPRGGLHPGVVRRGGSYTDSHARGHRHARTRPMTPVLRDAARADMGEVDLVDCAVSRAVAWRETAVGAAVNAAFGTGVSVGEGRGDVGVGVGVSGSGVMRASAGVAVGVAGTHANVDNMSGTSGGRSGSIHHVHAPQAHNQAISNPNPTPNPNANPSALSSTPSSHTYTYTSRASTSTYNSRSASMSTSYRSHATTTRTRPALTPSAPDRALLVRCCRRHTAALAVIACEAFTNRRDTRAALDAWARTVQAERYRAAYTCALRAELHAAQESTSAVNRASPSSSIESGDHFDSQLGAGTDLPVATPTGGIDIFDLDISDVSDTTTTIPTDTRDQEFAAELAETLDHTTAAQLAALAGTVARFPLSELSPDPEAWSACAPSGDEVGAQARRHMADDEGQTAALALARALTLVAGNVQTGGGGYGVAVAGTRMARVVAVADNVLALEVVPEEGEEKHPAGDSGGDAADRRQDRRQGEVDGEGDAKGGAEAGGGIEGKGEGEAEGAGETEAGGETQRGDGREKLDERSSSEKARTCTQTACVDSPPGNKDNDQEARKGPTHERTASRATLASQASLDTIDLESHTNPPPPIVLSLPAFLSSPTLLDRLPHDLLPASFRSDALLADVCEHAAGSPGTKTLQLPAYDYPTPVIDSDSDSDTPPPLDIGEAWVVGNGGLSASPAGSVPLPCPRGERCVRTVATAAVLHRPALQRYYDLLAAGLLAIGSRPRIACLEHVPLARGERAKQVRAVADEVKRRDENGESRLGNAMSTQAENAVETEPPAVDTALTVSGASTAIPRRAPGSLPLPRRTSSFTLFRNWILGRRDDLPEAPPAQQMEITAVPSTSEQDRGGEAVAANPDAKSQAPVMVPERQTSHHPETDDMNALAPEVAALTRALEVEGIVVVGVHPAFMDLLLRDAVARPSMWRLA